MCYIGFFYFLAKLVKEVSAVFEALINAAVTPASAIAFSFTWLLGDQAEVSVLRLPLQALVEFYLALSWRLYFLL